MTAASCDHECSQQYNSAPSVHPPDIEAWLSSTSSPSARSSPETLATATVSKTSTICSTTRTLETKKSSHQAQVHDERSDLPSLVTPVASSTPEPEPAPTQEAKPELKLCFKSSPGMACVETASRRICFQPTPAYLGVQYQPTSKAEAQRQFVPPPPMPPGVKYVIRASQPKDPAKTEDGKGKPKTEKSKANAPKAAKMKTDTAKSGKGGDDEGSAPKSAKSKPETAKPDKAVENEKVVVEKKAKNRFSPPSIATGVIYMYHREHTKLQIFSKAAQIWKPKYQRATLEFKIFLVATNFTVKNVIERIVSDDKKREEWAATEVEERGNGVWIKGTTLEYASDKAKGTLEAIGWNAKRGKDLPPVWVTIHPVPVKKAEGCKCKA